MRLRETGRSNFDDVRKGKGRRQEFSDNRQKSGHEKMSFTGDNSQKEGPKMDQFWILTSPESDPKMIKKK